MKTKEAPMTPPRTRKVFATLVSLAASVLLPVAAHAHHVVWIDMDSLTLSFFATINGNTPPTQNDIDSVKALVYSEMLEDYAPFDVTLTRRKPENGRYTRVSLLDSNQGGLYGCAGSDCCPAGGNCTGIDTWDDVTVSAAEIYTGSFAILSNLQGANATTARIANAIAGTSSHELGHVLGLSHCNAADDSITLGCANVNPGTADQNVLSHIMASGASWGLTSEQRATVDRFFSVHASRRMLQQRFQVRNHFLPLPRLGKDLRADLLYGRFASPTTTTWFRRLSTGAAFSAMFGTASSDAGDAGDIFLTGDVNGDGPDDLVYGRMLDSDHVRWYVRTTNLAGVLASTPTMWIDDAGDVGDIFRLGDVNGDKRDDLVYGRPLTSTTTRWYVRLSTGASFGAASVWRDDAGDQGDIFLLGDVNADGLADLVYGSIVSDTQVSWSVRRSSGAGFGAREEWVDDAGDRGDLFFLGSLGDPDADLAYARIDSDTKVRWFVRGSTGGSFGAYTTWASDAGDAGDIFRLGDGDGDGRLDLLYARPAGMTSLTSTPVTSRVTWYGRRSLGTSFSTWSVWAPNAGAEGDTIP